MFAPDMNSMESLQHPDLSSMRENLSKGRSAPADVVARPLLKIVGAETPPFLESKKAVNTASFSHVVAPRIWWPEVVRALGSFTHASTTPAPREFEISDHDLVIQDKVGEGLHSELFHATLQSERRQVAVKKLRSGFDTHNPGQTASMLKDLEFLARSLRHPAIIDFIGVNLAYGECAVNLVFEFMGGGTIEDYFDSGDLSTISLPQALNWGVQMFAGLRFLHARDPPIIYRDLKPSNLLLSADFKTLKMKDCGVSKCCDVGIKIFEEAGNKHAVVKTDLSRLTGPTLQGFTGTARYMAPETEPKSQKGIRSTYTAARTSSTLGYTPAADVYSGSLILWLLFEGQRPWELQHGHVARALAQTGHRPPLRNDTKGYPSRLAHLIADCWAHNTRVRPSAGEVEERLSAIAADLPASSVTCISRIQGLVLPQRRCTCG